jgi:hypothetical protein
VPDDRWSCLFLSPILHVKATFHFFVAQIGFAGAALLSALAPVLRIAH